MLLKGWIQSLFGWSFQEYAPEHWTGHAKERIPGTELPVEELTLGERGRSISDPRVEMSLLNFNVP